jgi:ankyrin repeat protein
MEDSPDKSIFINGQDHRRDACLITASREASSSMVSLLLDYGAEVDARHKRGRYALMEVSHWGRLETAQVLLSRGADKNLKDKKNRRALDLTEPNLQNRKERHTVAGGVWGDPFNEPMYKEDFVSRDTHRREIARILGKITALVGDGERQEPDATVHSFEGPPMVFLSLSTGMVQFGST